MRNRGGEGKPLVSDPTNPAPPVQAATAAKPPEEAKPAAAKNLRVVLKPDDAEAVTFADLREIMAAFAAVSSAPTTSAKVDAILKFAATFAKIIPGEMDDRIVEFAAAWNQNPNLHSFIVGLIDSFLSRPQGSETLLTPEHVAFLEANQAAFKLDPDALLSIAKIIADIVRMFRLFG